MCMWKVCLARGYTGIRRVRVECEEERERIGGVGRIREKGKDKG